MKEKSETSIMDLDEPQFIQELGHCLQKNRIAGDEPTNLRLFLHGDYKNLHAKEVGRSVEYMS